ncbi:beta-ketoacyl synthase chain length factor [Panacibacter ginsenosidivorans]|uniref:Beta-ketoacyl synthase chain length factor n=1 Tax=Panacibacter ginsenosidivorans TaxID=1813871 RepID=A0A5B8VEP3_9BACT|nr:beta-ketoacyl synthase chain length factor [Panacibacter ginsenosidivorans]QEC69451.1 beta-ketoacyl synthase chain length factor [Panacibacter ginsenosidivorans]
MLYIHQTSCISPQQTFGDVDLEHLHTSVNNQLQVIEPAYKNIPPGVLRRMSKNVKIGIAAALPLLQETKIDGIIIGTANGGMEESIKFLDQIVAYDEGLLTPGDFVQSTANAVASQISLMTANKSYNTTHVHRGFSFENALLDAAMMVKENPGQNFLVGGVDVISHYNYNIDILADCYKDESILSSELYNTNSKGTIAGEGAAMFLVNGLTENAIAKIEAIEMCYSKDTSVVKQSLDLFVDKNFKERDRPELLLSGEDGDIRSLEFYNAVESVLNSDTAIARFKHLTGDYATLTATALWLALYVLQQQNMPEHMIKRKTEDRFRKILIYNCYRQVQHSFILLSLP